MYAEKIDIQYKSQDWDEVKSILKLHIDRKFDEIISIVKNNEAQHRV
jgi:hypothetical protein